MSDANFNMAPKSITRIGGIRRKVVGVVAALSVVFAGTLAAAPMAGASGTSPTLSETFASADQVTTTSLNVGATISGTAWATMTDPSVKLYAVDVNDIAGVVPQDPPSLTHSCTASFMGQGSTWAKVASGLSYDLSGIRCSSATSCVAAGVGHLVLVTRATATATTWTVRQIG